VACWRGTQSEFLLLSPEGLGVEEELTCAADIFTDDARFFIFHMDAEVMGVEVKDDGIAFDELKNEIIGFILFGTSVLLVGTGVGDGKEETSVVHAGVKLAHGGVKLFQEEIGELGVKGVDAFVIGGKGE